MIFAGRGSDGLPGSPGDRLILSTDNRTPSNKTVNNDI